ncbi:MAG: hypothetical protein KF852_08230 [Saprospiraceae bacterium]|nr:hypothetical protein [Saprospiraceae bacterium]
MIRILLLLLLSFSTLQCSRHTPIGDIVDNPEKYQKPGATTIKGTVASKIDVMGFSAFKILDMSGEIRVVSSRSYQKGQEVVIKGHVENLLSLGNTKLIVFKEDEQE